MQQLTGLAVTRFAAFDLPAAAAAAGALGGLEVCVPAPVVDGTLGTVVPAGGTSTLDAARTLNLLRAADVRADPAHGRVRRQGAVLTALLEQAHARRTLLDPARAGALADALRARVVVDGLAGGQLLALARTLRAVGGGEVESAPLPTARERNIRGHLVVRERDSRALFDAVRAGQPLPEPDAGPADPGPTPADVELDVLNATDRAGLAAQVGETLAGFGFGVGEVGDAAPAPDSTVRFSPDRAAAAALVAAAVPGATPAPQPGTTGLLQLVLGPDFDGAVRAPGAAPPPLPSAAPTQEAEPVRCG